MKFPSHLAQTRSLVWRAVCVSSTPLTRHPMTEPPRVPSSPAQRAPLDIRFKHAMLLIDGKTPTEILQEQIRENGVIVGPERMLKVNHFVNHQVDPHLMSICGKDLAVRFRGLGVTRLLSARSGAILGHCCALHLRLPLVLALDQPPLTSSADTEVFQVSASDTQGSSGSDGVRGRHPSGLISTLYCSSEFLCKDDRVLIIDAFLSTGSTARMCSELVAAAGASVVGFGFLIEKCFENGRATLPTTNAAGERIEFESLAQLAAVTDGEISFVNPLPTDDFKL